MPTCVVVGMHRAGTSMVSRAVNLLGYSLGDPDQLIGPASDNAAGFWESTPIVNLNDTLLARLGGSWDAPPSLEPGWEDRDDLPPRDEVLAIVERVFGSAEYRAWKDPRASLLLPYWRRVFAMDHVVVVVRDPREVAASLQARNGLDSDWSNYLWLRYMAAAATGVEAPICVSYDDALADPRAWFHGLSEQVGTTPSTEADDAFVNTTDPTLRHHHAGGDLTGPLGGLAQEVFEHLTVEPSESIAALLPGLASGALNAGDHPGAQAAATMHAELSRTRIAVAPRVAIRTQLRRLQRETEAIQEEVGERDRQIATLHDRLREQDALVEERDQQMIALRDQVRDEVGEREQQMRALRDRLRDQDALEQQLRQARANLDRLRGRRSVRVALKVASLAKPAFQLRRRQRRLSERRPGHRPGPVLPDVVGSDPFHTRIRELVAQGVPRAFQAAWSASEDGLGTEAAADLARGPLVSIVMPTWNRAALIGEAISSVLAQSYDRWELLVCDDASTDDTESIVTGFEDERISYQRLPKGGAAAARNAGLMQARGDLVAYLDSDNLWHPRFLETMVAALAENPGRYAAYCKYVDVYVSADSVRLKKFDSLPFDYDRLAEKNFIDVNSLVHRRILHGHLGGFNTDLARQQDWDLILRYAYLHDPLYIDRFLALYRRNADWDQITTVHKHDPTSPAIVRSRVTAYYRDGLPSAWEGDLPSMSVVSWDICRNHFSKAYNLAEAMAERTAVQLVGFRFFDEPIFGPYATAEPSFATCYLPGGSFPEWQSAFARGVARAAQHEIVYAVKPRLPSLGVALLANYHFGRPIIFEANDLESLVTSPKSGQEVTEGVPISKVDPADPGLLDPYGPLWTSIMEGLAGRIPLRVSHNKPLDEHFGGGAFFVRNPKDERHYNPASYDRDEVRRHLGIEPTDRVVLFGGMVRKHKGVFQLLELLDRLGPRYRLLVVGSRDTPDQSVLKERAGGRVTFVDAVDRNEMAAVNLASDAVILWLDPDVPASRYQMPFKLTDALAMKVPVIANDIGDLGELGRSGYLRLAPFGDLDQLSSALDGLFADPEATSSMVEAGRRLYLRQFSFNAVRLNLEMILRIAADGAGVLPVAVEFAEFFSEFSARQCAPADSGAALR